MSVLGCQLLRSLRTYGKLCYLLYSKQLICLTERITPIECTLRNSCPVMLQATFSLNSIRMRTNEQFQVFKFLGFCSL